MGRGCDIIKFDCDSSEIEVQSQPFAVTSRCPVSPLVAEKEAQGCNDTALQSRKRKFWIVCVDGMYCTK